MRGVDEPNANVPRITRSLEPSRLPARRFELGAYLSILTSFLILFLFLLRYCQSFHYYLLLINLSVFLNIFL